MIYSSNWYICQSMKAARLSSSPTVWMKPCSYQTEYWCYQQGLLQSFCKSCTSLLHVHETAKHSSKVRNIWSFVGTCWMLSLAVRKSRRWACSPSQTVGSDETSSFGVELVLCHITPPFLLHPGP